MSDELTKVLLITFIFVISTMSIVYLIIALIDIICASIKIKHCRGNERMDTITATEVKGIGILIEQLLDKGYDITIKKEPIKDTEKVEYFITYRKDK